MHVALPILSLLKAEVDPAELKNAIFKEQALASGKPLNLLTKWLCRLRKFYEEVVLEERLVMMANSCKRCPYKSSKELGKDVKLAGFIRFGLGAELKKRDGFCS